jgi:hypothetical protein
MKHYLIIFLTILFTSCCRDKGLEKIQDKSWFPYKVKSNIFYETNNKLIDSLSVVYLDTTNQWNSGEWCTAGYEEYRNCTINSTKFKDLIIQISLDPRLLEFKINFKDKLTSLCYCTICNNPSYGTFNVNPINSINLNNLVYHDVLILTDSTKNFEIYYNRIGILRYIINKDTFNIIR